MHKTVEKYKKQDVELQQQVDELRQLVGERDIEVRDLAYKDLLPGQILRAQHALQALQDHLTEQHMRQLLGTEPLQAILGAINKEEEHKDPYYIQMIDSMDPSTILQQGGQGNENEQRGDIRGEIPLQQRADEIVAAIRQRKQQCDCSSPGLLKMTGEELTHQGDRRREILQERERGELQVRRRRRRRLVVATTTTVLACLSTVTTSLSQFMFTTLPFAAQQLQVVSNYVSWRQVERLQLAYNYSRQLSNYSWELYYNMTTTPKRDNNKKADGEVIDVETTEPGPSTRLPPLKAPTIQPLGGWREVRNYLINNLVNAHVFGFNYHEPSRTMGMYYAQFSELRLPPATDSDSDSEEEVQSMVETHNMWSPFHYDYVQEANPPRTYYICVEDSELQAWEDSNRTTLRLSSWKGTTSRVFQHLHLHEHPIEALNYVVALIHNSMSIATPPWNERLHLISLNLYAATTVGRHLMEYYHRDGSDYKELENHSDTLQGMDKFTTSTTVISRLREGDDDSSFLQDPPD